MEVIGRKVKEKLEGNGVKGVRGNGWSEVSKIGGFILGVVRGKKFGGKKARRKKF